MARTPSRHARQTWLLLAALGALAAPGATRTAADVPGGGYASVYARRLLARADADRNGMVDREEAERLQVAIADLDADGNGALDETELRRVPIRRLRTPGRSRLDVLYRKTPQEDLYLDLHLPPAPTGAVLPVVIYTHGGGWVTGSKENIAAGPKRNVALGLLDAGFAVASVNYRLCSPRSGVVMRDCIDDARVAARFLAAHAAEWGLDPGRFFVFGDSAGGQIAQLLLLEPAQAAVSAGDADRDRYRIRAGVSWYGPADFQQDDLFKNPDDRGRGDRFGSRILPAATAPNEAKSLLREMSPVAYLAAGTPPLLLVHGDRDTTIPVAHALLMQSRADAVHAAVETMIVANAGHNWRPSGGPVDPAVKAIVARTIAFLTRHNAGDTAGPTRASEGRNPEDSIPAPRKRNLK